MAATVTTGLALRPLALAWAVGWVAHPGEAVCGDRHLVRASPEGAILAVVDGLGHGELAARAAEAAVAALGSAGARDPEHLIARADAALRSTRGAAVSVAVVLPDPPRLAWSGVGNVETVLVRADRARSSIALQGGVVGGGTVRPHRGELPLAAGDTVAMATDGIDVGFRDDVDPWTDLGSLVRRILAARVRGTDDALVLLGRFLGG
ncbi:MAG TPA: SpoIIE family protein phosphatase [Actinomycetota bacterium]|nr:SpoIIE family protein phosphatase [Actinomycetota bacterium]